MVDILYRKNETVTIKLALVLENCVLPDLVSCTLSLWSICPFAKWKAPILPVVSSRLDDCYYVPTWFKYNGKVSTDTSSMSVLFSSILPRPAALTPSMEMLDFLLLGDKNKGVSRDPMTESNKDAKKKKLNYHIELDKGNQHQQEAVRNGRRSRLSFVFGDAGTGKSYTLALLTFVHIMEEQGTVFVVGANEASTMAIFENILRLREDFWPDSPNVYRLLPIADQLREYLVDDLFDKGKNTFYQN